ncbi:MAG: hypothetical protein Q8K99_04240 [Actinomycetota bacterium]|nr:hypothetical protein [Actinomycetota bacterium]
MCKNSVNTSQMQQAIEQGEMTVRLAQSAVHQLEHSAEHLGDASVSSALARAAMLLTDAARELAAAGAVVESPSVDGSAVVERV